MLLRSLIMIRGFKSFADKTVLGSRCVCHRRPQRIGKSNLVDAISWALDDKALDPSKAAWPT